MPTLPSVMREAGRVGDSSASAGDRHSCPSCPHEVAGPAVVGSGNVLVNNLPALRVGDTGEHASCCGENEWRAVQGAPGVLVNNLRFHRRGDGVLHCGGKGELISGSANVLVGDHSFAGSSALTWVACRLDFPDGTPAAGVRYTLTHEDGTTLTGVTDNEGRIRRHPLHDGWVEVSVAETHMFRG